MDIAHSRTRIKGRPDEHLANRARRVGHTNLDDGARDLRAEIRAGEPALTEALPEALTDGLARGRDVDEQIELDLDDLRPADPTFWRDRVREALAQRSGDVLAFAEDAVRACPGEFELLLLAALAALAVGQPVRAHAFLKRHRKRYLPGRPVSLLSAIAFAQQRQFTRAWTILSGAGIETLPLSARHFVGPAVMLDWLREHLLEIRLEHMRTQGRGAARRATRPCPVRPRPSAEPPAPQPRRTAVVAAPPPTAVPDLPRHDAGFDMQVAIANPLAIVLDGAETDPGLFRLRSELSLSLFEGFDELLCLPSLRGVETHWYQVETVRKVLKQYRGRVLLADEVGLGKTIEAGMVLKEYALRGMAERILILAPAALVGQWRDELAGKFGMDCATSHDPLLRADPARFWAQPRVIASIAAARRKEHAGLLAGLSYDAVVVDEAHHLRDQSSASYRLVNSLRKRFLLLLSATPVQNSLLELYNLLTLLKPGIFRTQKEFRSVYMAPGRPREPANRERLRDLMRGVMVRNTRALAALRLPRRHAATLRAAPDADEAGCYRDLSALAREMATDAQNRLAVHHLLAAAGSSPAAAAAAVARFVARHPDDARWAALLERYRSGSIGAKQAALLKLLARNPTEKKMVFVHHRDSMLHLAELLRAQGTDFALFDGSMSGPAKDAAVETFRTRLPVLLCSESGGEGRNLQFCNTLINFDIPWNPMAIEQRIGRIDRIGQTRAVFVFNLVTTGTIEDAVLRILDEKINMFELVVGEVGAILGEFEDRHDSRPWCSMPGCGLRNRRVSRRLPNWRDSLSRPDGNTTGRKRWTTHCSGTSSMPHEMSRMQGFVADLLSRQGALVEIIEPEGLEVLAPPQVQQALGVKELSRLGFGATVPAGAERVGIESDWLDRFGRLLGERSRCARMVLRPDARAPADPQRILEHALVLDNATFRLLDAVPAWTRYVILDFRFSAVSDEKRDGVIRLGVNLATGALPDAVLEHIAPWLATDTADTALPDDADLPPSWERCRLLELVNRALSPRLDAALAPFVRGLHRRLGRDQERLYAYHNELHREAGLRLSGLAADDPGRPREEKRSEAILREYRAKLNDLARQYAMRVVVEWVQTLELVMPVQRFAVQIRRRKAERVVHLDWNPLARRLEAPRCEFRCSADRPRLACDDALHLVTADGIAPCTGCGKVFCRACHRERCHRCRHPVFAARRADA
jgi:superfamily II DNA or RNA helicase